MRRLWLEIPAFLALAFGCALVSNTLAGPTRRLSWFPQEAPARATPTRAADTAAATDTATVVPSKPAGERPSPPNTIPTAPRSKDAMLSRFPPLVDAPQTEITSDESLWLHAHGALFLDARRTVSYTQGHIPGARCIPAWEDGLAEKVEQLSLFTPDLKAPVVVYCSGGDCQDSHLLAQKLWLAGFRNLRIYTDGYPDWEAKARPITKGDRP